MELAEMFALFGALGMVLAGCNVLALKVVQPNDVPAYVRARVRFWTAHNSTFMAGSAVLGAAGLTWLFLV
ncbi:hypothetical protein ACIA5D_45725 [Actinoplanes sp. NPDC051513]|uniref:hypothetical protein n=1 Tax=Actinoplanes sp. NPDC051513 TaxID=3363908 RepID=UPI0037AACE2E